MIREMKESDFSHVEKIENECFVDPYKMEQYLYELHDNPVAKLFVLEIENEIVGFIDYWVTFDACQLTKLAIAKKHRQKGYGSTLIDYMVNNAIEEDCEAIFLEVRESNISAQNLYEKHDFMEMNIRKNYYSDNHENARVMGKVIGGLKQ